MLRRCAVAVNFTLLRTRVIDTRFARSRKQPRKETHSMAKKAAKKKTKKKKK
jgi:hypothetical protein